jgi:DNA-directed RNA polymerase subunit K/omega
MIELPENFDSVFRYIVVVSQRAEQLINGARPRTESRFEKPTLEAKDDVDAGTVEWRVLSQAEIDAQRQAIVDQFRAEMSGEGLEADSDRPITDVLPTSGEEAAADDADETPDVEEVSLEAEAESEAEQDAKSDEEDEEG